MNPERTPASLSNLSRSDKILRHILFDTLKTVGMKRWILVSTILTLIISSAASLYNADKIPVGENIRPYLISKIDKTQKYLEVIKESKNPEEQKNFYRKAREHYKHIEFFVEYISPRQAKLYINGPLVPKHEVERGNEVHQPQGFQKIEEMLYSGDSVIPAELNTESEKLQKRLNEIKTYYQSFALNDNQLLEMMQLEFFRIASMNLSGYDATISLDGIHESKWCLDGIENVLTFYKPYTNAKPGSKDAYQQLLKQVKLAKKNLQSHPDYNTFDRLNFIVNHADPLNAAMVNFHRATGLAWTARKQALKLNKASLFAEESFNLQFFSVYYYDTLQIKEQAALGKMLFYDPSLSKHGDLSCATCHNPAKAFSDGRPLSLSTGLVEGDTRNTPALADVIFQKSFFYDGRAYQLEQQVFEVIHNKNEMQSNLADISEKLKTKPEYVALFKKAFTVNLDQQISPYAIQKAITEYEKTLVSFNSAFDQYLKGDKNKLSKEAIQGYNLFAGKALCGSCHFFPVFNGTVPPFYTDSEFEVLGVPDAPESKELDSDKGRYNVTKIKEHMHAFKTPTVRNTALSAPFMHNGIYNTLDEVVEFYHKGGGLGLGFKVDNQTLPFDSLSLNQQEKKSIVVFLESLTDTTDLIHHIK